MTILSLKALIFEGPYGNTIIFLRTSKLFETSSEIFRYSHVIFENPGNSQDENLTPLSQKKLAGIQQPLVSEI